MNIVERPSLVALAERVVGALGGLAWWSLLLEERETLLLQVERGVGLAPFRSRGRSALIGVMAQGNVAYASVTDFSESAIRQAVEAAVQRAQSAASVALYHAQDWPMATESGDWHSAFAQGIPLSVQDGLHQLHALDTVMAQSPQVVDRYAGLETRAIDRLFWHAAGARQRQYTHLCLPRLRVTASDGHEVQSRSFSPLGQGIATAELLQQLGFTTETAQRLTVEVRELVAAPNCPSGPWDLILSPGQMALQIHESIGHPLELDRILGDERNYAGWSFLQLADFGTLRYGSPLLNVVFDPAETGELAAYGFDDEGSKAERHYLIRDGILQRPLGGARSAARANMPALACARVCDPLRPPIDRMANINLEPGNQSFAEIIASTERGIWMDENRSWSIDQQRDKFQFGCEWGRLVEQGEIKGWVKNPNYRGRTLAFWQALDAVGDRSTYAVSGSPYCGKGELNQSITVGHASPICRFRGIEVFGGAA